MKRCFLLLALILLLTGCADQTEAPEPTIENVKAMAEWEVGEDLTLLGASSGGLLVHDNAALKLLSADTREILASTSLPGLDFAQEGDIRVGDRGVAYFDRQAGMLYFLDENLEKLSSMTLPFQVQGSVVLTDDWGSLYYCTTDGVQVLDMSTGISRTLTYRRENWLGVDCVFMDSALCCATEQSDGTVGRLIVSMKTGEVLWETGKITEIASCGKLYFGTMVTDGETEWVFGWGEDQPQNFWPHQGARIIPLLEHEQIITVCENELSCYDLNTGSCVAITACPGAAELDKLVYLDGGVYFMNGSKLCRWDLELTAVNSGKVYTTYRYTPGDPDEEGLHAQRMTAIGLNRRYGVDVLLWDDIEAAEPQGYTFIMEYLPENYPAALTELETALAVFGQDMLKEAAYWTDSGTMHIVLARSIVSDDGTVPCIQYILNGDIYIALALDGKVEQNFYHLMGHVIDTVVLARSLQWDDWEKLNPKGFAYLGDYTSSAKEYSDYIGEYFINENALRFQVEDRATILEYAIQPKKKKYFASEEMQAKLESLCLGIREAFDLSGDTYPWEQYLTEE